MSWWGIVWRFESAGAHTGSGALGRLLVDMGDSCHATHPRSVHAGQLPWLTQFPRAKKVDSIHPWLVYCLNKTCNKRVKQQNEWSSIWVGPERMSRMSSQSGACCARAESPVLCLGFLGLDTIHTLGCLTLSWGGGGVVSCALENIQQHPWLLAI